MKEGNETIKEEIPRYTEKKMRQYCNDKISQENSKYWELYSNFGNWISQLILIQHSMNYTKFKFKFWNVDQLIARI